MLVNRFFIELLYYGVFVPITSCPITKYSNNFEKPENIPGIKSSLNYYV